MRQGYLPRASRPRKPRLCQPSSAPRISPLRGWMATGTRPCTRPRLWSQPIRPSTSETGLSVGSSQTNCW